MDLGEVSSDALLSEDGLYRYWLSRSWAEGGRVSFIMLNPSTADAMQDDPTIRRCMGFAHGWGYRSLKVYNLFSFRATSPKDLKQAEDPIGPEGDLYLKLAASGPGVDLVVAAWGTHGAYRDRGPKVIQMLQPLLRAKHLKLRCLGMTKAGHPKHPLYLKGNTALVEYSK